MKRTSEAFVGPAICILFARGRSSSNPKVLVDTFVQWIRQPAYGSIETCGIMRGEPKMSIESIETDRRGMTSLRPVASLFLMAPLVLCGCSQGPEYSIFGSFFPVWIFCSSGGLALAAGARWLVARTAIAEHIAAPVLCYVSMAIFLACMLWLPFYS